MIAAFVALALQGAPPELTATVDRDHVAVGEEITFTVRAVSHSREPMDVVVDPIHGLAIVSRSERTEIGQSSTGPSRATTLEVRLRAVRAGRWELGPARATQGGRTVRADPVVIEVEDARRALAATLSPRVRRLLERAPPPRDPRSASVALIVGADSVTVGEQVDVLTAAWFPRDLRAQLRRPPTLQPPVIAGVWSYPQPVPAGIAASRTIRGTVYDLFIAHQVIFPLTPGTLAIDPATLKYTLPVALQFFSQEERFALSSRPVRLAVLPEPRAGKPRGYAGAVGSGLAMRRSLASQATRVGEAVGMEVTVSGSGNVSLWPAPELTWPPAVRAYTDRTDDQVGTINGLVGGTKRFRYLVVPDSAGWVTLPGVSYPYFDLATRRYVTLAAGAERIRVERAAEAASNRSLPPPLMDEQRPSVAWLAAHAVPTAAWLVLLALPPAFWFARSRRRRATRTTPPAMPENDAARAERRLDDLLHAILPLDTERAEEHLVASLKAAGVEPELAARIVALRSEINRSRYGPGGEDGTTLLTRVRSIERRLAGGAGARRRSAALLGLSLLAGGVASAQTSPHELYASGSLRAAAEGFQHRIEEQPGVAANWYNLGAAHYRMGDDTRAAASWLRAARLAPRDRSIRRALRLSGVTALDEGWLWTAPATAEELGLLAGALWLCAWAVRFTRPRARRRFVALVGAAIVVAGAALALGRWYDRPLALVAAQTNLLVSPHGRAPVIATVETGSVIAIDRRSGAWVLATAASGRAGWLPAHAIVPVAQ